ncbi:hypothetical protein D3C81_2277660 [compost metagenome]
MLGCPVERSIMSRPSLASFSLTESIFLVGLSLSLYMEGLKSYSKRHLHIGGRLVWGKVL